MPEFPKSEIEALWSPWRVEYYQQKLPAGDFLLEAAQATDDAAHLVVARQKASFLIMNRYPYSAGHLMAVPYRKVADLDDLAEGELLEIFQMVSLAKKLLKSVVRAQGFNVGMNLGRAAGAGVRPAQPHKHRPAGRVADVAHRPVAALASTLGEVMAADRLGVAREAARQLGSVAGHHATPRALRLCCGDAADPSQNGRPARGRNITRGAT